MKSLTIIIASIFANEILLAQNSPVIIKDKFPITRAAGQQYAASGWKSFWWGKHYRKEWTARVQFNVLDFASIDGGLQPLKIGGGHQTKTLRMISGNGREYVLRTIDKNLDVLVPDALKETFINDIVNDQISTAHPYGPIAIAQMAEAISILHTNPVIYYVPDDPVLGEFRSTFANKLCLLEERPSGKGWEHTPQFGNADDIVNTEKLLEKIDANTKNTVDQKTYLTIRFFDMVINDWDRHEDQWVWTKKEMKDKNVYTPIARDRDQAFSKTDGVNMFLISLPWALRPLKNMNPTIHDVRGANFSARNLDELLLNQLTKDDWKQAILYIETKLTDTAIKAAINTMPPEVTSISGKFLIKRLIQRKDNLSRYGMKYYRVQAKRVTITGSNESEKFVVNGISKKQIAVTGISAKNDTFYHRVFNRKETKEINVYGLQGNDEFKWSGKAKNRFKVRLLDSSYKYNKKSVVYDWYIPLIIPGYNPDDGVVIGLGLLYKKQQWGKSPYGWQQQLQATYAAGTGAIGFEYRGIFKQTIGKWDLDLNAYYKGPRYTLNYYGLGNETKLNNNRRTYFRVKANDLYVDPGVSRTIKKNYLRFGLQYQQVEVLRSQDKFITSPESEINPDVFSKLHFAGAKIDWLFSATAIQIAAKLSYLNNLENTDEKLLYANSAVTINHTILKNLSIHHRTGAATVFGNFQFYQAATLGSQENLRGFWRNRFAGKSSFYQNTELRLNLANFNGYLVRGRFGALCFVDDGRVWMENEKSSKLHVGYGGGVFFLPYNLTSLNLYYSRSNEAELVTLRTKFFF